MSPTAPNCTCLEDATPTTCAACVFGVCPRCSYPHEIDCHRHAPSVGEHGARFPEVRRSGWCGDFQSRETIEDVYAKVEAAQKRANDFALQFYRLSDAAKSYAAVDPSEVSNTGTPPTRETTSSSGEGQ